MSNVEMNPPDTREVVLQPGEFFVGDRKHRVHTLLGSCVSITLWHPRARIGAMSHYMLAQRGSNDRDVALNARYGEEALTLMIEQLACLGVAAASCQAKVFGGGEMFMSHPCTPTVGRRNGHAARALLRERGIALTAASMFGVGHRNIIFNVDTGDVWSRQVDPSSVVLVPRQELPCPISR